MKIARALLIAAVFLMTGEVSFAQEDISQRQRLIEKKEARKKEEVVQEIKETYRNISASLKAGRKTHAEDQMKHMETLLSHSAVPDPFRKRMAKKLGALKKRYALSVPEPRVAPPSPELSRELSREPSPELSSELSPEEIAQVEKLFALEYQTDAAEETPERDTKGRDERRALLQKKYFEKVDALYQQGVLFYQQEFYDLAGEIFRELNRIEPGYKDTETYLRSIDDEQKSQQSD